MKISYSNPIIKAISSLVCSVLLNSCSTPQKTVPPNSAISGKRIILFVPGLYGSLLSDANTGERVFQTLGNALWGTTPLAFHGKALQIPGSLELKADGIFEGVSVIPLLYRVDAYGGTMEYLEKQFGGSRTVLSYSYDWRQEDSVSARGLGEKILELRQAGASSIVLVGHSLGAALIAYYLRYGSQPVEKAVETWEGCQSVDAAVLASLPFRGSLSSFRDFLHGTAIGLAKTPLNALSLGSFPSFYEFLPPVESNAYVNSELSPIGPRVYEAKNWVDWKAGLFSEVPTPPTTTLARRLSYTIQSLEVGNRFSTLMRAKPEKSNSRKLPTLFIMGKGYSTLSRAVLNSNAKWDFFSEADGDGLVSLESQTPPKALTQNLSAQDMTLEMEHRGVYTRADVQEKLSQFFTQNGL